jgi:hypothetical protein
MNTCELLKARVESVTAKLTVEPKAESDNSDTNFTSTEEAEEQLELGKQCSANDKCKRCIVCCLELLNELSLYRAMYSSLLSDYKFIPTLSCTQVSCERAFSTLKIVKKQTKICSGTGLVEQLCSLYSSQRFHF